MKSTIAKKVLEEMKTYILAFKKGELKTYELLPMGENVPPMRVGKPFLTLQSLSLMCDTTHEEITLYAFKRNQNGALVHREFYYTMIDFLNVVECLIINGLALGDYDVKSMEWILANGFYYKQERIQMLKDKAQLLYCKKVGERTLPTKDEIFVSSTKD